jgi:hypothetical protein
MRNEVYILSILDITFIILLILKLTGLITWSWWIVVFPILLGLVLLMGSVLFSMWGDYKIKKQ